MPNLYTATNTKKFLDADGLTHFAQKLNQYPTNDVIEAVVEGVQDALDEKIDISEKGASDGVATLDSTGKVPSSQIPPYTTMTGATSSADGSSGMVPAPTTADTGKFLRGDGTWGESGKPMVVLSYGNSTWNDFLEAYNNNVIVYCKASSNSNPASGTQKRMAFMAYVDNHNVEFQYYRSVSSHTNAQQGDQTYVYKLTDANVWSVTVRENYTKVVAGTGMSSTYNGGQITLAATNNGTITGITMNGESRGTSGVVNLGTVLTEHQDISGKLDANLKGVPNGVAELDANGRVPSSQLPSYVDDVLEYADQTDFPSTGETGKIYVDLTSNLTYRWGGSAYVEISPSIALGTTSSTAFRGDYGDAAYAHAVTNKGVALTPGIYTLTTNSEGHVTNGIPIVKQDITALGIPSENTTYTLSQNPPESRTLVLTGSDGTSTTITIPDGETVTLEDLGIENVTNYDQSKAISRITRNGTTFTYTCLDGTLGTFDQQDTWTAMVGATLSQDGTAGYVPAPPSQNYNTAYLRADGTWAIPPDTNTDTQVTSAANHYTPEASPSGTLNVTASGGSVAWGDEYVKGVTLDTDGKGHVTHVAVSSGKLPSLGTTVGTVAEGNHTHNTSIVSTIGTEQLTLDPSSKYMLTAGGTSFNFQTPPDTTYTAITDAEIDSIMPGGTSGSDSSGSIVISIANGGTGASTVAGARQNLGVPDVVNNLTTDDSSKALSAAQGKALSESIASFNERIEQVDSLNNNIAKKIDKEYAEEKCFVAKTWNGLSSFAPSYIWTDGVNFYYSGGSNQYVLDKATSTWSTKTWNGRSSFNGSSIWTDGDNIYYSNGSLNYVLDKTTSTWSIITWNGLSSFDGSNIWTDGVNIYYSRGSDQYVLDKTTSTWSTKTWNGLSSFYPSGIWTDGVNIYYSSSSTQYVLDKATSTWSAKTWNGLSNFSGSSIWTDGENIYYSASSDQYVLDKTTSTWSIITWNGLSSFSGFYIWTDGENIYYSSGSDQYVLDSKPKLLIGKNGSFTPIDFQDVVDMIDIPDDVSQSVTALEDGIAILANGDIHAAITNGQFVYVRNHTTLAEGLYHATASIATNGVLSTSNLAAEPSGGLNALKAKIGNVGNTDLQSQITSLNSKITTLNYTGTVNSLQTSLVSLASSMDVGDFHSIKYTAGETLSPFRNADIYGGTFKRTGSNYWSVMLEDPEGLPIYGTYRNGTWHWEEFALNSKFVTQTLEVTVTTGYFRVSYPSGFNSGNTILSINHVYASGCTPGYTFTYQLQGGDIIVYTRNFTFTNGLPPDNTVLSLRLMFVKLT